MVRGVVFGQIDERLRMSWSMFEKVLTHFPAEVQRERDALWRRCEEQQARIDAALALCGPEGVELFHPQPTSIREHPIPGYARDRLRAALTAPVTTQTEGGS
ncbi:hypothetical protein [Amycolatopsis sp. DSM 110486]|uniref:hypothetical protein n=1 Tax=Amycolatopsis sp. DSM 110486 TaxID=2865832 RepID=UPI001C69D7EE|nr:hypothetical protein [Amycolatopsis sp. DSM 110486]QYN17542.1 hypothetical protein K1T34_32675 [Amycolatopsis sp. DSM 110486]